MTKKIMNRPSKFSEVFGHTDIIKQLEKQISKGDIHNGYLFAGPSGVGKTTVARIFANEISNDVVELDAASNNGVDDIREINKACKYAGEKKVFILDEAHMLTKSAWNALLKTLEDGNATFILCTTEPNKVPETVKSRTIEMGFISPSPETIFIEGKTDQEIFNAYYLCNGNIRKMMTILENDEIISNSYQGLKDVFIALSKNDYYTMVKTLEDIDELTTDPYGFIDKIIDIIIQLRIYAITREINVMKYSYDEDTIKTILNGMVTKRDGKVEVLQADLANFYEALKSVSPYVTQTMQRNVIRNTFLNIL